MNIAYDSPRAICLLLAIGIQDKAPPGITVLPADTLTLFNQTVAINWNAVEAIATLLSAIGAVAALAFIYHQINTSRKIAACEFILNLSGRYESEEIQDKRRRLAKVLLLNQHLWDPSNQAEDGEEFDRMSLYADEVLAYFERLGMMLREGLVPIYFLWTTHYSRVSRYYEIMFPYIKWIRTEDSAYYIDFQYLYQRLSSFDYHQRKRSTSLLPRLLPRSGRLKSPAKSHAELKKFLLQELRVRLRPFASEDMQKTLVSPALEERLRTYDQQGDFIVVAETLKRDVPGHEYLGYLVAYISDETSEKKPEGGYLREIFVDSRFRGLGVGEKLCRYALEHMNQWGVNRCYVELPVSDPSVAFYENIGFIRGDSLVNYFSGGIDAYRMEKKLRE